MTNVVFAPGTKEYQKVVRVCNQYRAQGYDLCKEEGCIYAIKGNNTVLVYRIKK